MQFSYGNVIYTDSIRAALKVLLTIRLRNALPNRSRCSRWQGSRRRRRNGGWAPSRSLVWENLSIFISWWLMYLLFSGFAFGLSLSSNFLLSLVFFCFHVFLTFLMSFSFIAIFRVLTYESKTYTGLQLRNVVERFLRFFSVWEELPGIALVLHVIWGCEIDLVLHRFAY